MLVRSIENMSNKLVLSYYVAYSVRQSDMSVAPVVRSLALEYMPLKHILNSVSFGGHH